MSRRRHQGHLKRHNYPGDEPRRQRQDRGNGNGRGGGQHNHRDPRYLTLAEGQQNPDFRELLKEKPIKITLLIYGPRLSGTKDFKRKIIEGEEKKGQSLSFGNDPLETFGRIYAGDIFKDLFDQHKFVCTGAAFESRNKEVGDTDGVNRFYFQRLGNTSPNQEVLDYRRPPLCYIPGQLAQRSFHKIQFYPPVPDQWGTKHTLKILPGTPRTSQVKKPLWNVVARQWILEPVVPT